MKHTEKPTRKALAVNTKHMWQEEIRTKGGDSVWKGEATVLWARKRDGILTVFLGSLIGFQPEKATTIAGWMHRYDQPMERRRMASYNGTRHWCRGAGLDSEERLLEEFHRGELPALFEGWWIPELTAPRGGYGHHPRADDPTVALCGAAPLMTGIKDGPGLICPVCETAKKALQNA